MRSTKNGPATVTAEEIRRIEARFTRPAYEKLADIEYSDVKTPFNAWLKRNPWFEQELLPVLRREVRKLL